MDQFKRCRNQIEYGKTTGPTSLSMTHLILKKINDVGAKHLSLDVRGQGHGAGPVIRVIRSSAKSSLLL